jgi:hypothetical protein
MKKFIMKAREKMLSASIRVKDVLSDNSGQGMIDLAVNILISIVLGALVLGGLYLLFGSTILPMLAEKIKEMFDYKG